MRILYIHQYFITPDEPGGTRSYWIAKELVEKGYEVTMLTSSSKFSDKITEKYIDGIKVIYLKEDYNQNMSLLRRLKAFLNFMFSSSIVALKQKNIDLVIATSTPLTIGIPALMMKWFKKVNFVFEVRDLWPEVPIQMGAIKNPILIYLTKLLEKIIYKNATHIVALSPGMQDGVVKYVSRSKTTMIPNMAKIDEFWPKSKNFQLANNLNINDNSFKVIHFGALGLANGAGSILETAKLLKEDNSVTFLFVGGGSTEKELKHICKAEKLCNVKFLGKFSMKDTSEIVNIADVSVVSFKDLPILYTNSPNKLFDSLSAAKPIIVNSAGWTKDLVENNNCGYYVNPNKPVELMQKIKYLQSNPDILDEMSKNSRKLAEESFDKSILCSKFATLIDTYNV
jgi:glycosyltransferase involved in cell wall biosynthesis